MEIINRLSEFNQNSETKWRVKRYSINREVNHYDSCFPEKEITLECTQFQALMIPENVQGNLYREQAIIVESNSFPFMEMT